MKNKVLFALWAVLYVLCVLFGMLGPAEGFGSVLLFLLSLVFFVPGIILLYRSLRDHDRKTLRLIRILCGASLGLTLLALVASFFTVLASQWVGNLLHVILVLVSAPMVCCRYWALSLFLWACLLMASFCKKK